MQPPKTKIRATTPWMILIKDIRLLEHDAGSQYKFNRFWAIVWACAMLTMVYPLWPHNVDEFTQLLILEVSLWANFATHFSGMSSALAARNTTHTLDDTADVVQDLNDDIDEIHAVTERLDDLLPPSVE